MIALFKQKTPANTVILLIFGLLLKMPLFLHAKNIAATEQDGKLYRYFLSVLPVDNAFVSAVISFLLLYVQALMINYLMNEQRMTNKQNYLAAMSYMLITSLLPEWNYLSAPLVSTTLIIWCFIKLFNLYNIASARGSIFNIGLLVGISSFIYFPSAGFIICIIIGLLILRAFQLSEIILLFIGALTPYYFYAVYLFLVDKLTLQNVFPSINVEVPAIKSTIYLAISVVLITIPFLVGGYFIQVHLRKMLIQVRKNWSILVFYLLLALFIPFINNSEGDYNNWILIAAPFAAFHTSGYLYPTKKWLPMVLFLLTVAFIIFQQYATPLWH